MSNLSTQPYKGARDFYPDDMRLQSYIFSVWQSVCERYGYEAYNAPILEPLELYTAKSGQEIVNEQTYNFEDRGGRQVTIRPEMTPTVARMVAARRQELSYPLRLYSIPNLWRYERPQRGRLREHWQLNVDVFGLADLSAETELILLSHDIMQAFGATNDMYEIRINSRKLTNTIMRDYLGLDKVQAELMIKLLDRFRKLERDEFEQQALEIFEAEDAVAGYEKLRSLINNRDMSQLPDELKENPELEPIKQVMRRLTDHAITNAKFDITLMRGFDYYTDIVFEVFDTSPENNRSMFGGGRYDGLVGLFGVEPIPTVGFGMGDVVIADFLATHQLLPDLKAETDVYLVLIGDVTEGADKLGRKLRQEGINAVIDYSGRKVDAQLKTALAKKVPYVIFVGEQEVQEQQFNLKHLPTQNEERHAPDRIAAIILDSRQN